MMCRMAARQLNNTPRFSTLTQNKVKLRLAREVGGGTEFNELKIYTRNCVRWMRKCQIARDLYIGWDLTMPQFAAKTNLPKAITHSYKPSQL